MTVSDDMYASEHIRGVLISVQRYRELVAGEAADEHGACEVERLRQRVAELEATRETDNETYAIWSREWRARGEAAEERAKRAEAERDEKRRWLSAALGLDDSATWSDVLCRAHDYDTALCRIAGLCGSPEERSWTATVGLVEAVIRGAKNVAKQWEALDRPAPQPTDAEVERLVVVARDAWGDAPQFNSWSHVVRAILAAQQQYAPAVLPINEEHQALVDRLVGERVKGTAAKRPLAPACDGPLVEWIRAAVWKNRLRSDTGEACAREIAAEVAGRLPSVGELRNDIHWVRSLGEETEAENLLDLLRTRLGLDDGSCEALVARDERLRTAMRSMVSNELCLDTPERAEPEPSEPEQAGTLPDEVDAALAEYWEATGRRYVEAYNKLAVVLRRYMRPEPDAASVEAIMGILDGHYGDVAGHRLPAERIVARYGPTPTVPVVRLPSVEEVADMARRHTPETAAHEILDLVRDAQQAAPIDMVLHCPSCGTQHIDEPAGDWTNPPHRSHLCHACGTIWRPASVPTSGVASVPRGTSDTWGPGEGVAPVVRLPSVEELSTALDQYRHRHDGGYGAATEALDMVRQSLRESASSLIDMSILVAVAAKLVAWHDAFNDGTAAEASIALDELNVEIDGPVLAELQQLAACGPKEGE